MNTHILKFGGTSVGSAAGLENVVRVIRERAAERRVTVVVSALSGVTSQLDDAALRGDASIVARLQRRHTELLHAMTGNRWNGSGAAIDRLFGTLHARLRQPSSPGSPAHDEILGIGERLSAPLVAEVLRGRGLHAVAIDATEVVTTDAAHGNAQIDLEVTRARLELRLASLADGEIAVITGYVGATPLGAPTTLGRGGSDITAAVIGALLDADAVEIWSDVDGIFSADPRLAADAVRLPQLSHGSALRLAESGARVLHAAAIPPLAQRGIRLSIRNTFAPEREGTEIGAREPVELILAGATGNVGTALWRQLDRLRPAGVNVKLVANSRRTLSGFDLDRQRLAADGAATDWSSTLRTLREHSDRRRLFVDCTASPDVAALYEELLDSGIGIVTANKLAGSGVEERWRRLRRLAERRELPLLYETTVGAALPVLRTARDLAATGDRLLSVDAVLSGTLSYILGRLHDGRDFSAAVTEAAAKGFTEPDPMIDLSGRDVAAKLVILLRDLGVAIEPSSVLVEPMAETREALATGDARWHECADAAAVRGNRLVYVASWRDGTASARVREIRADDPLARLRPGENIVIFRTGRYESVPLTIAGPGAGPEITAAGLLAEILEVARE